MGVRIKLNPVEGVLKDRRVVIIDDTIVRGTTTGEIIRLLREAGRQRGSYVYQRSSDNASLLLWD